MMVGHTRPQLNQEARTYFTAAVRVVCSNVWVIDFYIPHPRSPILYMILTYASFWQFDLRTKFATKLFVCNSFEDKSDYMPIISLYAIAIDPMNPNLFAIAGSDEYARVYDIRRYRWNGSANFGHPTDCFCPTHLIGDRQVGITGLAFSDQSELLASYNDELIYLFLKDHGLGPNPIDRYLSCTMSGAAKDLYTRPEPQAYRGHRNRDTLKGVSFYGPSCDYVVTGSDCGRIFMWKKKGGELVQVLVGDKSIVNCIEPHPYATVLASSGIESDVKIWTPNSVEPAPPVNMEEVMYAYRYCLYAAILWSFIFLIIVDQLSFKPD